MTFAPSELPIVFACRSVSSARLTWSRISINRPHRAARSRSCMASTFGREFGQVDGVLARAWQMPPQLVGGHRQDRREQPGQPVADDEHRRLRGPSLRDAAANV